jgi:hypothetical protein
MASVLHAVSHHDLKNLDARVGGAIANLLESWDGITDAAKIGRLREIRANARLAFMGAGLDCLWAGPDSRLDRETVSDLKRVLEPAVDFRRKRVVFHGHWDSEALVPSALRVVFANLIRNAINTKGNTEVVADARVGSDSAEFICRSAMPMVSRWRQEAFVDPPSTEPPSKHRGLWICRRIIVDLCHGEWSLAEETDQFKTNIRVGIPLGSRSEKK